MRVVSMIFLIILLAGCDSAGSLSDTEYVARAHDYLDKGELNAASIELKNALLHNPNNTQARWLLGSLYLETGDMPSAEKELVKARELGVSDESVFPLLARAYLAQGKYDDVLGLGVQSSFSKEVQASLLTSQGIATLRQGNSKKADEFIATAMRMKPDLPYALYGQAETDIVSQDYGKARESLNQALEYDPEYAPAWELIGDLERRANHPESAEHAYSKALENSFEDVGYRLKRALVRIQLQQLEDAQKDLNKLKKQLPNHPGVNYAQGLISFLQRKYTDAQESFQLALRVDENYMPAVLYLGATNFALKNEGQSITYLSRYISAFPSYVPARKLLAIMALHQRHYKRAEELIRPVVISDSNDVMALNLMANALLGQGETEEAIQILKRVSTLQPESAFAKTRLGLGLLVQGEEPDAVASLKSAIELEPEFQQAEVLLILNYLYKQEYDQAQQAAQNFIGRQPDNPLAQNLLGLAYLGKKQLEQAKKAFTTATEISPGDPVACQNLAVLALRNSKPEEARRLYQQVLEKNENHLGTLIKLAALEGGQGDATGMKSTLERAMKAHPDAVQPRILLARYYLLAKNVDQASEVMGDLSEKHPNDLSVLNMMGELDLAKEEYSAARIALERLVKHSPKSAQAHYLLAQAYAGLDNKTMMEQELNRALELEPKHYLALIAQTRTQIKDGKSEQAEKNLALLKEGAADNPEVLALEAALRAKLGDNTLASSLLEQRFHTTPTSESLLDLTRFKWSVGERLEAIETIEEWLATHQDDVVVRIALADAYLAQGRNDDAIAQYEAILEVSENNLYALNNLAWNLRSKDPVRALAYGEKAISIDPESPDVMDTLSELLLEKGELNRAERLNMKALEKNPDSLTYLYRKARILEATGKKDEAVAVLKKILDSQQTFPARTEAEAMLNHLGGG